MYIYGKNVAKEKLKHPTDVVNVGDIVTVYVDEIYKDKNKVSLTMIKPNISVNN